MYRILFVFPFILVAAFGAAGRAEAVVAGRNVAYFFRSYQSERSAASEAPDDVAVEEIDRTGPGSVPLSDSLENRISRYLLNDRCPIGREKAVQERCAFLLKLQRVPSGRALNERLSPRTRNVIEQVEEGVQIHRSIGGTYGKQVQNTTAVLRAQKQSGGLRGRPRTLSDVKDLQAEVERAHATRRSQRESSVPLPIVDDGEEGSE